MEKKGNGFLGIFIVLIVFVLLIGGCAKDKGPNVPEGPYAGGDVGLEFAFEKDAPPPSVLDAKQQEFPITLLLRNRGEFTIPRNGAIISLSGIDRRAFNLPSLSAKNNFEIQGVVKDRDLIIRGAEEVLGFGDATYVNDIPADFTLTLRADACYTYKTQAITSLCLKRNVLQKSIEDVCEINVPNLIVHNSGAPVKVTNARQSSVGSGRVKVVFTVANVGQGIVYLPGTFSQSCSGGEKNKDKLKVTLSNPQNNFNVKCSTLGGKGSGEVRLVNKKKEISCVIETGGLQEVTFQDLLKFDVDYTYREAITIPVRVENAV